MMKNPATNFKIDNSIAAIWSMMLPGLGQMMKGQIMPGIFWAFFVGFGYFAFLWPGLIFHALCILDAALSRGEKSNKLLLAGLVLTLLAYIWFRNF
jgi:TM2 domain-containing membrane protein YozV